MAGRSCIPRAGDAAPKTSRSLSLGPHASSAALARRFVRELLTSEGRGEWLDIAELACTELITNAVLHAHTAIEVYVEVRPDELLVEVRDRSPVMPVQRAYDRYATTGRGMALVAALTSDHGIRDAGPHGKTAWFIVRGAADDRDEADLLAAWDDATWDPPTAEHTSPADPEPDAEAVFTVRLLRMPATLWLAARQHHDAILRELVLYLAEHEVADVDLAAADRARALVSTSVWDAVARQKPQDTAGRPSPDHGAIPEALHPFDLDLPVPVAAITTFARLQDALDAAERLAAAGALLASPGLPEVVAVRDWACEQVITQHGGAPPSPWAGIDQPAFVARLGDNQRRDEDADIAVVRTSPDGLVAADDTNRIIAVSPALAELLGWDPDELVGRRIVTLIPPRYREAHIAGFTRFLTTGESRILDVPLLVPVLHADGREILCHLLIRPVPDRPTLNRRYVAEISAALADAPPSQSVARRPGNGQDRPLQP